MLQYYKKRGIYLMNANNILKTFRIRLLSIVLVTLFLSVSSVYYIKKQEFYSDLTYNIIKIIEKHISHNDGHLMIYNKIRELDFIFFKLDFKNDNTVYEYHNPSIAVDKILSNKKKNFNKATKDYYEFIEMPSDDYFMAFHHLIYLDGKYFGSIEGLKQVDSQFVSEAVSNIYEVLLFIVLILILFILIIYPVIYFSHTSLKDSINKEIQNNISTIKTLGNTIALRDSDTNEHNYRVTLYSIKLAEYLEISKVKIGELIIGAFLHDIGKIGITDSILLKNGKLTDEEFEIMKQHVNKGVDLLEGNEWLMQGIDVVKYHHERVDGKGYPFQIKEHDIPIIARIFAIVDVFDALTSVRPYKKAFTYEDSIKILQKGAGSHFDKEILTLFIKMSKAIYNEIQTKDIKKLREILSDKLIYYFE